MKANCGFVVSAFTLYEKWSESWVEIFNALRDGVVSSVVVIWFAYQVGELVMSAYQYFEELRKQKIQKIRQEERERILKRLENSLQEQRVSEKVIQHTVQKCLFLRQ